MLPRGPRELGFDYSFVTASCKNMYPFVLIENRKAVSRIKPDPKPETDFGKKNVYGPRLIAEDWNTALVGQTYTEKTITFLRKHKAEHPDRPFYIHLTYEAPHKPHDVPERFVGVSGVSQHCDQILYLDAMVGEVLKAVDELGYEAKLHELIADVRADLVSPDLPLIVGDLGQLYGIGENPDPDPDKVVRVGKVRAILRGVPEKVGNTALVETTGLTYSDAPKCTHFDKESYIILGQRYAEAYEQVSKANE